MLYFISKLYCIAYNPFAVFAGDQLQYHICNGPAYSPKPECKHFVAITSVWYIRGTKLPNLCTVWLMSYDAIVLHLGWLLFVSIILVWISKMICIRVCSCGIVLCLGRGSMCSVLQILITHRRNMNGSEYYIIFAVAGSASSVFCGCM